MRVLAQTYPPLGQVTPVQADFVNFKAVIELPISRHDEDWEVSLWHSADGAKWNDVDLEELSPRSAPQCLHPRSESTTKRYFGKRLLIRNSLRFTLKHRPRGTSEWLWIADQQGLGDGTVVLQASEPPAKNLQDLVEGLSSEWDVRSSLSQAPNTLLWSLEANVLGRDHDDDGDNDASTFKDLVIGSPKSKTLRWFALVRHSSAWLGPRQGAEYLSLDKDAILFAFLTDNGRCLVFLGVSGITDVMSVLRSTAEGNLSVHAQCDAIKPQQGKAVVLVAESADLGHAVAAVMYHARTLGWNHPRLAKEPHNEDLDTNNESRIEPQWLENWYDGLGYCTWNSLGQDITEESLLDALRTLSKHKIQVSNLIIDDGWQDIDTRGKSQFDLGWKNFEAAPESFPSGLKNTVSKIRHEFPHIQHMAVWHALLGYWGGIASDGHIANTYDTLQLCRRDQGMDLDGKMLVVAEGDVSRFYNDFYQFLSNAGIDSVKTDVQFMVDTWADSQARRQLLYTYLGDWNLAALRHFSMRTVSCMSLFPQWIFHLLSATARPTYPLRTSDDFFPDEPDSHPWHLWSNAHNCILLQYLNIVPDWDMFQTAHHWAGFHAAARCVSGGPIYITDVPGKHDLDIVRQISGRTPRGKTVIFRPSVIGKAISPFIGFGDQTLLKVGSYHGASQIGVPIMGVFNVSNCLLTELIPLSDFSGTADSLEYIVRAHTTGLVSSPTRLEAQNSLFSVTLDARGYEILSAFPLKTLPRRAPDRGTVSVATLGLVDKMTGCAAVTSNIIEQQFSGRLVVKANVKALGVLGVYISSLPDLTIEGDFMVTIQGQAIPLHTVRVSRQSQYVLEVDVEAAWEEMGLDSGWSNEVPVKLNFTA